MTAVQLSTVTFRFVNFGAQLRLPAEEKAMDECEDRLIFRIFYSISSFEDRRTPYDLTFGDEALKRSLSLNSKYRITNLMLTYT